MKSNRKRSVTIGLVQMQCSDSPEKNLQTALTRIEEAAKRGAEIIALPELFLSPYFCRRKDDERAFALAEEIPGATAQALSSVAKELKITLVGGSIFERAKGKYFNTAVVFDVNGKMIQKYRKTHIPEDNLYHEQHYFSPGDTGISVVQTSFGKIAVLICYDQWFPEAARVATLQGAEIIFYPTAIGTIDESVEENVTGDWQRMWTNAQLGHAAVNNVYVAAVNRVGREDAINFWGGSFIADPSSALIARAGHQEEIILAKCDLDRVKELQEAWRFLECRRPEIYGALTRKSEARNPKSEGNSNSQI